MYKGEISKNESGPWEHIEIGSLDELQTNCENMWTKKGSRTKKIRNLDGTQFRDFFVESASDLVVPATPSTTNLPLTDKRNKTLEPAKDVKQIKTAEPAMVQPSNDQAKILAELANGMKDALILASDSVVTTFKSSTANIHEDLHVLTKTIAATNFEIQAKVLAEKFLEDLQSQTTKKLQEWEKAVGQTTVSAQQTNDGIEAIKKDLETQIRTLRGLKSDIHDDTSDLLERIKKYGWGHVGVLEQQNARLRKELEDALNQCTTLHTKLAQERLARGAYDPVLFDRIFKENQQLATAKLELDLIKLEHANAQQELANLRPLRNEKIATAQNVKELSDLRAWKSKYQPELNHAKEVAKLLGEEVRRLETDKRTLAGKLRDLNEDVLNIQELKETAESSKKLSSTLQTQNTKLTNSEAKAKEEAARFKEQVAEGLEAYRREVESQHARTILELEARHRRELDRYVETVNRTSAVLNEWQNKAEDLGAKLKQFEDDDLLGLPLRHADLRQQFIALQSENEKRTLDIANAKANRQQLAEQVDALKRDLQQLTEQRARYVAECEMLAKQLEKHEQAQCKLDEHRVAQKERIFSQVFARVESLTHPDEWTWLQRVGASIRDAGFKFSPRLLNAFHTALKSQDISPLTLLAGISGTGKSELPRLYADAGGILFLPVAVQPNWDSPADLFGFYNYTEGVFHSTPMCRAIRQFTDSEHIHSMGDRVLIVLLDEMNLARVEHYFSDLLSRLEIRRSILRQNGEASQDQWSRASVELNLGEGAPELLRLGANILFVGTLNQDESTLDLSDKVVDRANMITFPRPNQFVDTVTSLQNANTVTQLSLGQWQQWCEADQLRKNKVEEKLSGQFKTVSDALKIYSRGVGQRVFQATMRYVALYPADPSNDGIEAAIEDQFAMKLIPKLKGIDTKSTRGRECLNLFKKAVPDNLRGAFEDASENEFFEWRGADHMFVTI